MKDELILYFSDRYAFDVMGVKRSIYDEVKRRGIAIRWIDKRHITDIVRLVRRARATQVWLAHSGLVLPIDVKRKLKCVVVGFGFSDPYYFKPVRLQSYDIYVTNHIGTLRTFEKKHRVFYNPTACDATFHKNLYLPKTIDVSLIGCGKHPRFKNKMERVEVLNCFRKLSPETSIEAYGKDWPTNQHNHSHVVGVKFLRVINNSKIGLDIQDEYSPLAHRIFEYPACGTPIITRRRAEVLQHLEEGKEIICYNTHAELFELLVYYLNNPKELQEIADAGYAKVRTKHTIVNRVNVLIKNLGLA